MQFLHLSTACKEYGFSILFPFYFIKIRGISIDSSYFIYNYLFFLVFKAPANSNTNIPSAAVSVSFSPVFGNLTFSFL